MKHIVKKHYDEVRLSPEKKQAMLTNILKKKRAGRPERRSAWKIAAAIGVAAAVALAIVLPLMLGGNGAAENDQIAMEAVPSPTAAQITPVAETKSYVSTIVLSLNPDVEIRLDEEGVVTEVVGLNEDGIALVEGIEFAGLSLQNVTIMVVNQLILQEYITAAEIQNEINISLESDDMTLDTLTVMTDIIRTAAAEHNIAVAVIEDEDANALQIVLEGEGSPDILPELDPQEGDTPLPPEEAIPDEDIEIGLEVEFVMAQRTNSAYVDNVLIHPEGGETIDYLLDFVDSTLNKAALFGIIELIEKEYITDENGGSATRFSFTGSCKDSDIIGVAHLTELLVAEYDLKLAVGPNVEAKEIVLEYDETVSHEAQGSKHAIKDLLNGMVNKDETDLSPRQIDILKAVFNYREYFWMFEKRYHIVIPDLIGMSEEQAIDLLQQLGIVPVVVREKVPGYDPTQENGGLAPADEFADAPYTSEEEYPEGVDSSSVDLPAEPADRPTWDFPVVEFGCVFYQDGMPGSTCATGGPFQINVVVPEGDERPEMLDFRDDSGIVLRAMDVPFDVSAYPDTFLLSEAGGFDAMIDDMNATYTIRDKADYTVVIDRDMGWEDTAMITITHKDGFPQSKYFVQDGRIIEVEFLWRRNAPTAEDGG